MKKDSTLKDEYFEERPWGSFEILYESKLTKVKKIHVKPGEVLSYQSHEKRAEDWIVLEGGGFIILNDVLSSVTAGDHFRIPVNTKHRIGSNSDGRGLTFIEVQTGTYFGEDDIKRYSDEYDRDVQ